MSDGGTASLRGKTALVTGAGRGLGHAIALRLAAEGARVVAAGRNARALELVAKETGGLVLVVDLADRANVEAAAKRVLVEAGPIHVLVNNAGIAESAPFASTIDASWDAMMAVNVTAPFVLCRALVPRMIEAGFGRVVNVASNAGLTGYRFAAAYSATKHALVGLTRSMALEVAHAPVTVNAVCPGWVDTDMSADAVRKIADKTGRTPEQARRSLEAMSPQKRMLDPVEVADLVAVLCAPASRGIHGQAIAIDGGQVMT